MLMHIKLKAEAAANVESLNVKWFGKRLFCGHGKKMLFPPRVRKMQARESTLEK
jgi:hypothetical protein